MIELLSSTKVSSLEPKKNISPTINDQFKNQLEDSLSQQKALKEEIQQYKTEEKKKELKELTEKVKELKKSLQSDEELNEKTNKLITSLEQIVSFLQDATQAIDKGSISSEVSIDSWVEEMNSFLQQGVHKISQGEELPFLHKAAFILEGIDISLSSIDKQKAVQINTVLQNILGDFEQALITENVTGISQEEGIVLDSSFKLVDTIESIEINEEGNINVSENIDMINDSEETTTQMTFGDSSSNEENTESQQFKIVDYRSKKPVAMTGELREPFTLEQMDMDTKMMDVQSNTATVKSFKGDAMIAERLYSSFSSAVSRVQVEALMQNVSGKVSMILQDGGNELRMKLTPPELGQMKLSFLSEDGMMRGKIVVETPEAKLFFEQNINNLRESLANVGVSLGSVDVELGNNQDFSSSESEQEAGIKAIRTTQQTEGITQRESSLVSPDVIVDFTA